MKKIISLLLILILGLAVVGCSKETATQKTEEELREEVKEEMEAEAKLKEKLKKEIIAEMEKEKKEENNVALPKEEPILLSVKMTKDEIVENLGNNYTIDTIEDMDGYLDTRIKYPDIIFTFEYIPEKLPGDAYPAFIEILSNKYQYNDDIKIGNHALDAIKYCENNFENVKNMHSAKEEELPDWFIYKEKNSSGKCIDTQYVLSFTYNTGERYFSKDEIGKDVIIESIRFFSEYD
ncbi:hypothetical protein [Crassaminicella profunda]|uniref:hypothetical protein n=1 Tax=Crassaminicella profunda TaxID=1286698 RepID=UPI001CA6301B|nr:hypothetical protein [Crassaminicella profunda]QZY57247.1 hypothetical protein K7H06_10140 [Crassaminicella profunda]